MRQPLSDRPPSGHARRGLAISLAIAVMLATLAGVAATAPAKTLQEKLANVKHRKVVLAKGIAGLNQQVDQLIGEISKLRVQESAVQARLDAKQAELDRASAALKRQQHELQVLRARLRRAQAVLAARLVQIYKAGEPDVVSLALHSATFSDLISQTDYLDRIRNADDLIAARVHTLREQTHAAVVGLTATRNQLESARNAIAAERDRVARARAAVEARQSNLIAARQARERALKPLNLEAKKIQGNITQQLLQQAQSAHPGQIPPSVHIPNPSGRAKLLPNGQAVPPDNAPAAIKGAIAAANRIATRPYVWGGGHGSFESSGYDCSGAVSYALHGGGFLSTPMDSTGLETWGASGFGRWFSVFANSGHAWAIIAGLRWDTSGTGGNGPRWSTLQRGPAGYIVRHPAGY
jgi:cell wall-associated NlpC family hydrolase/regulator of replication initiation timing